ncbi:hypothetical protein V3C99_018417 [Haemonchus contortus]|uniref:Uncharacterized protein n=1 Tax=Haemonchus contortus TaxID=6289 RepID=A0A7I4Z1H8_HAECO
MRVDPKEVLFYSICFEKTWIHKKRIPEKQGGCDAPQGLTQYVREVISNFRTNRQTDRQTDRQSALYI